MVYKYLSKREILLVYYTVTNYKDHLQKVGIEKEEAFDKLVHDAQTVYHKGKTDKESMLNVAYHYLYTTIKESIFYSANIQAAIAVFLTYLKVNNHYLALEDKQLTRIVNNSLNYDSKNALEMLNDHLTDYIKPVEEQSAEQS